MRAKSCSSAGVRHWPCRTGLTCSVRPVLRGEQRRLGHDALCNRARAIAEDIDPMTGVPYENPDVRLPKPACAPSMLDRPRRPTTGQSRAMLAAQVGCARVAALWQQSVPKSMHLPDKHFARRVKRALQLQACNGKLVSCSRVQAQRGGRRHAVGVPPRGAAGRQRRRRQAAHPATARHRQPQLLLPRPDAAARAGRAHRVRA
jgi:hypothetical protein